MRKNTRIAIENAKNGAGIQDRLSPEAVRSLVARLEREKWEIHLMRDIKAVKLPIPFKQYKFHPVYEYKADFCWPDIKFIVEVDGGIHMEKSGHTTGTGYERDRIRDAEAFLLGYKVLRVTPGMIERGQAIDYIERLFKGYNDNGGN